MVDTALKSFVGQSGVSSGVFTRWQPIRNVFAQLWYGVQQTPAQQQQARDNLQALMTQLKAHAVKTGCPQYIVEDNSFPSGRVRCVSRQWDLVEMAQLVRPFAEMKVVALYRDPAAMTFSHEDFDGGLIDHARMVAVHLEHLNNRLLRLDPATVKVLHYEDLVDRQQEIVSPLSRFLNIEERHVQLGLREVRRSRKDWKTDLPPEKRDWLEDFFSEERLALWPVFQDDSYSIRNF